MMSIFSFLTFILASQAAETLSFKDQCLKWHNYYRTIHQVGRVRWSEALRQEAENWADKLAKNNENKHENGKASSDNLWVSGNHPREPCTEATKAFYEEEKFYDYKKPAWSWEAGHFTQLVWNSTNAIGAAQKIRKDKRLLVVIKYLPPGNINAPGYYEKNVFPPLKQTTESTVTNATLVTPLCNVTVIIGNATNTTATVISVCSTTPTAPVVRAGSQNVVFTTFVGILCLLFEYVAKYC